MVLHYPAPVAVWLFFDHCFLLVAWQMELYRLGGSENNATARHGTADSVWTLIRHENLNLLKGPSEPMEFIVWSKA